jgi:hypothetical protein
MMRTKPSRSPAATLAMDRLSVTATLCASLHRFAFLLGASDGEELFGEPAP